MLADKPNLLVYVRADILGDALLKLPALPTLRKAFPDHHITWFAGCGNSIYASLLLPLVSDYLDEVKQGTTLGKNWSELLKPCPVNKYHDVIIDTQHGLKSTLALKRIPHRRFISPAAGFFFSDNKPGESVPYTGNMQQRLVGLIKLASENEVETHPFSLQLPSEYQDLARELLPPGGPWIGMAPGAGGKEKIWPLENFITVARCQQEKDRVPVFFLGPDEQDMYPELVEALPGARFPEQENRQNNIKGPLLAMALAKNIKVALANDSGMGHVFAISGSPLVSLFGPSNSEKFATSRSDRINIEAKGFGEAEMKNIPAQAVIEAIDRLYE